MKKNILLSALAALLFTACSDEELVPMVDQPVDGEQITITVGMPSSENQSRVSLDGEKPSLTWESGDKLTVVGYAADTYVAQSEFTIDDTSIDANSKIAKFKGTLSSDNSITHYVAYYTTNAKKLACANKAYGTVTMDYTGQTQTAVNSTAHLKDYLYLCTAKIAKADFSSSQLSLGLKNSIMKFKMNSVDSRIANGCGLSKLVWSNNGNPIELTLSGWGKNTGNAYFCFDPSKMNLASGGPISLTINVSGSGYSPVSFKVSATSPAGKTYSAGTMYSINVSADPTINTTPNTLSPWKVCIPDNEVWVKNENNSMKPTAEGDITYNFENFKNSLDYWILKTDGLVSEGSFINGKIFSMSTISEAYLPKSIKSIIAQEFSGSKSLRKVTFEGLESLNRNNKAFHYLVNLELVFPSTMNIFGGTPFMDTSVTNMTVKFKFNGDYAPFLPTYFQMKHFQNLIIHESWKQAVDMDKKRWPAHYKGANWNTITFIDDNGNIVP